MTGWIPRNNDILYISLGGFTEWLFQVGPLPVINGVITPLSRVITPVTHLFSAVRL